MGAGCQGGVVLDLRGLGLADAGKLPLWNSSTEPSSHLCAAAIPSPCPAANTKLADADTKLKEVREKVATLNAQLATLEQSYAAAVADKDAAVAQAEACQRKLGLANRLIAALASGG